MPIYAYACTSCEQEVDKLQKISEPALTECPYCGEQTLQRQLTAPNFRLGGSGWYETDFKRDNDKQRNLVKYSESSNDKSEGDKSESSQTNTAKATAEKPVTSNDSKTKKETTTAKPTSETSR